MPRDDLRFYVALHETVHAATRSVPWVRERLVELAMQYVSSYEIDPSAFEAEFGMIDPQDPDSLQRLTESPERVLGAMQSPRQSAREELQRLTSVIEGYADRARLGHGSSRRSTRSTRRCSVTGSSAASRTFIETARSSSATHYERGRPSRRRRRAGGIEGLNRFWERRRCCPPPTSSTPLALARPHRTSADRTVERERTERAMGRSDSEAEQ